MRCFNILFPHQVFKSQGTFENSSSLPFECFIFTCIHVSQTSITKLVFFQSSVTSSSQFTQILVLKPVPGKPEWLVTLFKHT